MKLSELAKELQNARCTGEAEITGLCIDSRVAGRGELFFAFRGTHVDSHDFAQEAEARGAVAIVCERDTGVTCPQLFVEDVREAMSRIAAAFYAHPEREMKFFGVTGTNGKTTTAYLLRSILLAHGVRTGIIGTLGAEYANRRVAPVLTTPDPVFLFSLLADMRESGVEAVVMEVSAHALALKKELPIVYEGAIFTNLTQDHLDFFGDMQAYGEAKRALFCRQRCRRAFLNADDPFTATLKKGGMPYETYGLEEPADDFAVIEREGMLGTRMLLNLNDELVEAEIALTGRHNVLNALAAAAAARAFGARAEEIALGIGSLKGVDGRLEYAGSMNGGAVFVDFAHTPDGLKKSLSALREHCRGRLFVLFGCGGNRDRAKRPVMGEIASTLADFCIVTSDNPRYEDPCSIMAEIEAGIPSKNYVAIEERERAIAYALQHLQAGDILLVAGKGGERTQEIMGIKYAYDDKTVITSLIGKGSH